MSKEPIVINLDQKEQEVTLQSKNGQGIYFVREMNGADRDSYMKKMGEKMEVDRNGKVVGMKSYDGLQSCLLGYCMYDSEGKRLSLSKIQEFSATAQNALFQIAQKLNAIDAESVEEAKNESRENEKTGIE